MDTATAWEQFHAGEEPRDVRGEVLTSWRRSRFSGVDPEHTDVPYIETELDTHFTRVATPIMEGMAELLVGDRSCLALADPRGSVTWRWVSEPMLRTTLDQLSVAEGFCWDEELVGTNGLGTALETGAIAVVRGSEHFVHRFHEFTCVAAPVRHPITRRTVGAVNVTCRAEHTNPLLTVVVRKLVDEIRAALLQESSVRERRLLDAFLVAQRGAAGPVITLGDDVVIANGAAQQLGLDHQELWADMRGQADGAVVALPSDLSARVRLVRDGTATTGAVLTITGPPPRVAEPATRHRRVVCGPELRRSPVAPDRWPELVAQTRALAARGPVAIRGESGTGKATLLAAVLPDAVVLDAATCAVEGLGSWARRLGESGPMVVRHVELLTDEAAATVAALAGDRIAVTANGPDRLVDRIGAATLTLPPLRRRTDEIAGLARRELLRHGDRLTFAPETVNALRRYDWPGNHRELARVVSEAARQARAGVVGPGGLPPEVRAAAARRALTPLERAESTVIAAVLQECDGNKSAAAKQLGISRTALYAKLRAYRL